VLTSDLGDDSAEGARLALALPCLRPSRKNIDYLRPDEITNIVAALSDESNGLSLRDRAIVSLMYHTCIRSVDVVGMRLSDIDWGRDRIELTQEKTGQLL
jgi:integrase